MTSVEQLTGHTTVQASAGSGKTYLLISRIVRLLLTGTEAGNILAITFTRKAANEMQTRLLERLYELAICDEDTLENKLKELHITFNSDTVDLSRSLYEKILRSEAPVKTSTFHAFCQELLRRFPMEANISPGFDLLDKTSLIYDEAWDALMAEANKSKDGPLAKSLQFLFKELGLYNSKQALTNFIEHRSDWWAYVGDKAEPAQYAKQKLQQQLCIEHISNPVEDLFNEKSNITLLNEFHVLLCKHDTATNLKTSELIYQVIDEDVNLTLRFKLFKQCFLTQTGSPLKRKESKAAEKKMGADGQERFIELHILISDKLTQVNAQLAAIQTMETNSAWYIAGEQYLKQFQKLKKEQRLLDFTDLEWQTYLLLTKSNNALWVQYKLDQRIEHLLVDEFQDTNPTQWRLLLPLLQEIAASEDDRNRSVFIVGDTKQSIYRFRRAEPRLFTAAEHWLKEHLNANSEELSHSWRSSPAIISFINNIFSQEQFKALLPDYTEHKTHREKLTGTVTLLPLSKRDINEKTDEQDVVFRNPLDTPREESTSLQYFNEGLMIAKEIKHLIQQKTAVAKKYGDEAINYNDIIILLRSRTHVADYERALRNSGIPYIGANRGTLLESLEVNDMLDLLQWLILPFDNLSLAGILRSPLFSVSNEDLIALKQAAKGSWFERLEKFVEINPQHASLSRAYQLLLQWQDDASKLPVHDLLDKIYSEANVLARYIAAFPSHLGQRVTTNLTRFLELALEMDSGRYPSLSRFSSWLNELRQMENEAPDEPVTPASEETEQRVQILSVHAAKGLEAPVIFLADSANSPSNKKAYSTLIDWPAEKEQPEYFLLTAAKLDLDEFSKTCLKEQEAFEQRENANLLYVALTRAKQRLYISGSEPKNKDQGWYGKICAAYQIDTKENAEPVVLEKTGDDKIINITKKIRDKKEHPINGELSSPIKLIYNHIDISPSQQTTFSHQKNDADEGNTLRGIIMHKMLNYLSRSKSNTLAQFYTPEVNEIDKTDLKDWWLECEKVISDEVFSHYFNPSKFDKFYNEVPIQFKDGPQTVYGIIDRLVIKDNYVTIIDYKTHPYVNEENIAEVAQHYKKQMQLYRKGVELLWPDYKITTILIFTSIARHIIF